MKKIIVPNGGVAPELKKLKFEEGKKKPKKKLKLKQIKNVFGVNDQKISKKIF